MPKIRVPRFSIWCVVAVLCLTGLPLAFSQTAVQNRILQAADNGQMTILQGNIHPMARQQFDQGRVSPDMQIQGVSLVFKLSAAQQSALNQLLVEQRDPASANYHKWLTPEQYAARFGMSQDDLDKVTQWLTSQGFTGMQVSRGRNAISFDGSVAQIESAFRTQMHHYLVNGELHFANSTALALPAAFADVALAVRRLHDFRPKARARQVVPHFTSSQTGNHFISPGDFATIYNLPSNFDGTGITIVVAGQTQLGTTASDLTDVAAFRAASGLPANPPTLLLLTGSGTSTLYSADVDEANLDVEWSGGVAKGAKIIYEYVGNGANFGVFDAWTDAIDNNRGQIVSVSYGLCEADFGATSALAAQQVAQQANAQGQTLTAASGDAGAADCDGDATTAVSSATRGLSVDLPAGLPEVTGLGGTEFNGDAEGTASGTPSNASATTYWSGTTGGTDKIASALSYIPEMGWNDSPGTGTGPVLSNVLFATGGGASAAFSKPSWQTGPGVPSDNARDVPDVSLAGSPNHDGFLVCSQGSCTSGFRDSSGNLNVFGGTSVDSQAFAGVLAILNQATTKGLGNVNPTLYALAANLSGAPTFPFHDVTSGSNIVPCTLGTVDCSAGTFGYSAGAGYDLVTGLGSVDVSKLITAWKAFAPSADFSIEGLQTGVSAAGQTATSTITLEALHGFSGTVTLSCALTPPSSTVQITCGFTSPTAGATTSVPVSGSAASTATLSIVTVALHGISKPSADARPHGLFGWWLASGGALFAGIFIVGVPRCRWHWVAMPMLVCFALLAAGIGCGGGSSGGGGGTTPTAGTPTFSPAPGTYVGNVSVTVSDATAGATLHCTTDGSTPTTSSPSCATMNLTATTTVNAVAVASGYNNSAVASGTYTITTATPTFSPAPGTYTGSVSVTVSDATAGATLHCTTDGSTPTASSPACAAMNLTATTTVKAIAIASGQNNSAVASGTYTIQTGTPTAGTPTFSPAPGTYVGNVSVTVSDATAGATLHCTTDGSTPTTSSPSCATMNLTATTTIKAIAVASGYNNSLIASGTYTIQTGTPVGAYVVQVTATSGSITHTTNIAVTVQ